MLFADVAGGDDPAVARCLEGLLDVVATNGGTVRDRDEARICCCFASLAAAVQCAFELQRGVPRELDLRIGLSDGPLDDRTASRARDIVARARSRQILTTRGVTSRIPHHTTLRARIVDPASSVEDSGDLAELFESTPHSDRLELVLEHGGVTRRVDGEHPRLSLGRGPRCDLIVKGAGVSRIHALIELRKTQFVLVDQSTNGTRLVDETGASVHVRNAERRLGGRGQLLIGPPHGDLGAGIAFEVRPPG
jgi:hypothetical protein